MGLFLCSVVSMKEPRAGHVKPELGRGEGTRRGEPTPHFQVKAMDRRRRIVINELSLRLWEGG